MLLGFIDKLKQIVLLVLLRRIAFALFTFTTNTTQKVAETQNFSVLHVPIFKLNTKM